MRNICLLIIILLGCNILYSQSGKAHQLSHQLIDINCGNKNKRIYIIKTYEEYKKLCFSNSLSKSFFEEKILLGVRESTGGCGTPITNIKVQNNYKSKTIDCIVDIEIFGSCRRLFYINKWFVIDKPTEEGYNININVIKHNN